MTCTFCRYQNISSTSRPAKLSVPASISSPCGQTDEGAGTYGSKQMAVDVVVAVHHRFLLFSVVVVLLLCAAAAAAA